MDFDLDALQLLVPQEAQTTAACNKSCQPTVCTFTCRVTDA
ncbi:ALQxL family class IV lanthipeptide [Kitasatospora paranensis]|uniref:ALQxL family class IV lanthipeptide n=1 Tax=Kitasatospora paranensis TaxID=258053 RepID=A0ABW2FTX9_9ACTN